LSPYSTSHRTTPTAETTHRVHLENKVILYYTNDKRTCLHTMNKLSRRTAQQVPARGI